MPRMLEKPPEVTCIIADDLPAVPLISSTGEEGFLISVTLWDALSYLIWAPERLTVLHHVIINHKSKVRCKFSRVAGRINDQSTSIA